MGAKSEATHRVKEILPPLEGHFIAPLPHRVVKHSVQALAFNNLYIYRTLRLAMRCS